MNAKRKMKEAGVPCMLNTEIGAVLAVLRKGATELSVGPAEESPYQDVSLQQSLRSLRTLIFNPQQDWRNMDPSIYLSPFLDVILSDEVPAVGTMVALAAILKIVKIEIFNERTPAAKDAMNAIVIATTGCRVEKTATHVQEAILMRILQILTAAMDSPASVLLSDDAVCTIINTCFNILQQSNISDPLKRTAHFTMHEIIRNVYCRLIEIEVRTGEDDDQSDDEEDYYPESSSSLAASSGYGIRCAVDIFQFLCSLLNVVETVETEEYVVSQKTNEEVQVIALVMMNTALELSGGVLWKHPKLLRMIQDDLMHHLIHYGTFTSPLVLSMICSIVLNIYNFLRRYTRLQLEAYFVFVLSRVATAGYSLQMQEVALEAIVSFLRQPGFLIEIYVNYDCSFMCWNLFEEMGKLLCKQAFPTSGPMTSSQVQAFEGLLLMVHTIADCIDKESSVAASFGSYPIEIREYVPFWEDVARDDAELEEWIDALRLRKAQKKKLMMAANHFNQDEKKGLEYLKLSNLVPHDPPDAKAVAYFFRFTPRLDKTALGDYLGDPDTFHLQVLREFTCTFEFCGMLLDSALRSYLETFRLPGESQKIQRILEAFSERFYEQQSSELFESKDAVFILCYSLIMLNTDQHNPQVKRKMTEDEFIKNNRAINGGKDLPREYLSELFQSIANNAITMFGQMGPVEMTPSRWIEIINRSRATKPYVLCKFDPRLGRDMFSTIAGPCVAALSAIFEHVDEDDIMNESIEGLISVARIAQHGVEDILDELLASMCKFTTLLNPYASTEETLYIFANDMKPRMATLAVFTIANKFGESIRGAWRDIVDCLLKLKRLKLLPQSVIDSPESSASADRASHSRSGSGSIPYGSDSRAPNRRHSTSMVGRFAPFLPMDGNEDSLVLMGSEFEQNLKIIQQCKIGSIFNNSNLPEESLINLGRSLIFAAAGRGQKFGTAIEEEETVCFCWDLILTTSLANINKISLFWPGYHDNMLTVAQFPMFSPVPFAEKGILVLFKLAVKLLSCYRIDKYPEELLFKSINLMWKFDKEILDTCCDLIMQSVSKILIDYPTNVQTPLGWKSLLHLLSVTGRHPEAYDLGVETLINLMSEAHCVTRTNYAYCIDCAFGFVALKISLVEKNFKILDLLANSVTHLIQWYKNFSDPGSSMSSASIASSSSTEDSISSTFMINLFVKLGEALRKTSLARREEIRNHAIFALKKSFVLAGELDLTPAHCINCFNYIIFAMVDDLHEKMIEYSRRANAEKEMRSMENTLKYAMELLTDVFLQYLKPISESTAFKPFWLGLLRRMDTCMKADLGEHGPSKMQDLVPDLLKRIITEMKDQDILVPREDDDLWEITYIQIQWIAPSLGDSSLM
ncbi:hypothetical protein V2J09_017786 [Rumex salicifolius]